MELQTLSLLASKLGGPVSTVIASRWPDRVTVPNPSIAIQGGSPCGPSAAAGFLEMSMFLFSQTRVGRGDVGFPSNPPPSHDNLQYAFRCVGSLARGSAELAQYNFRYLAESLAFSTFIVVWELQNEIRSAGRILRSIDMVPFYMNHCSQLIDLTACQLLRQKGLHPFPY